MSLSAQVEAARKAEIIETDLTILILDIERLPGRASVQHRGLTIEGDFWDLNSWKHTIGRRIHADDVTEWPRTICAAWQNYGDTKVQFAAEWDADGRSGMLQRTWDAYDQADIVVGHNLAGFDTKKLQTDWWLAGMPEPSGWQTIDTLKAARARLGAESNTLDALLKRAGLIAKTDRYEVQVARDACAGDVKAQRKLKAYNVGDIHATRNLYDSLRGRIPNHPNLVFTDPLAEPCCNQCGSDKVKADGIVRGPNGTTAYKGWRCKTCGAKMRDTKLHRRTAWTTGVR